ncbi:hypothetical protein ASF58_19030 [Methylobacterium sp. Leaf125]|nr:hypothetical protein ASF58_19030 [Methylobacterium sp. Leaf125]
MSCFLRFESGQACAHDGRRDTGPFETPCSRSQKPCSEMGRAGCIDYDGADPPLSQVEPRGVQGGHERGGIIACPPGHQGRPPQVVEADPGTILDQALLRRQRGDRPLRRRRARGFQPSRDVGTALGPQTAQD